MNLRRVVAEAGSVPSGKRSKAHIAYFFGREIERWSEARGAPTIPGIPTHHAKHPALANCMLIAGLGCGIEIDHLAHAMLEAHWRDDANLADRPTLAAIGRAVGIDPESFSMARARRRYAKSIRQIPKRRSVAPCSVRRPMW